MTTKVKLSGLHCPACQKLTSRIIGKIDGVSAVAVDLEKSEATIFANGEVTIEEINKVFEGTNYQGLEIIN